jgi:hypothetical protein
MVSSYTNDPEYWRGRAEEARATAEEMHDPASKTALLKIAQGYEYLAANAAKRAKGS